MLYQMYQGLEDLMEPFRRMASAGLKMRDALGRLNSELYPPLKETGFKLRSRASSALPALIDGTRRTSSGGSEKFLIAGAADKNAKGDKGAKADKGDKPSAADSTPTPIPAATPTPAKAGKK